LTHSYFAKVLAVKRVTENKGRRTPGIDGEIWSTDSSKMKAALKLTDRHYKAKPLRRVNIPKKGKRGALRPLGIPTMYDRAMQALYLLALDPIVEVGADLNSFGFRKGRSAKDAGQYLFGALSRKFNAQWVLEGDIKGCFDNISHTWLLDNVEMDKSVLTQFIKAGYVFNGELFPTHQGTPQGGVISAALANTTLDGIQGILAERFGTNSKGKRSVKAESANKVHLCRYADDFVITANTKEIAEEAKAIVVGFLAERGLVLSEEKTLITHIDDGFDFLGWNFRKYSGKLIIKPSKKSVKAIWLELFHNKKSTKRKILLQIVVIINY
jgi:RNA-directed DNA polymerase